MSAAAILEGGTSVLHLPLQLPLRHGGVLRGARLAYELAGDPSGPLVLVLGGISAGRHVVRGRDAQRGWWDGVVGHGSAVDLNRCAVLGVDYLGGCGGSTGPEDTAGPFPSVSTDDQAAAIERLLVHLGVERPCAVVGSSYGGMVGLALAARAPHRVARLVAIAAADRPHPRATAWRALQRALVRDGLDRGEGERALRWARALAMTTYRSADEFAARFDAPPRWSADGPRFAVEDYLAARGEAFARRFTPRAFLALSESLDTHRVAPDTVAVPLTLVGITGDAVVPESQVRGLADRLPRATYQRLQSQHGHDGFLLEEAAVGELLRRALVGVVR